MSQKAPHLTSVTIKFPIPFGCSIRIYFPMISKVDLPPNLFVTLVFPMFPLLILFIIYFSMQIPIYSVVC